MTFSITNPSGHYWHELKIVDHKKKPVKCELFVTILHRIRVENIRGYSKHLLAGISAKVALRIS